MFIVWITIAITCVKSFRAASFCVSAATVGLCGFLFLVYYYGGKRMKAASVRMASGWRCIVPLLILGISSTLAADEFPLLMPKAQPTAEETYLCTPVLLSDDHTHYVTAFRPNATAHTAHHMLIYGCEEPGSMDPLWNCGEMAVAQPGLDSHQPCKRGTQIIYAWAKDAPELILPANTGFRVGADTSVKYLVLQVHYAHLDKIPPTGDDSGVFLHFTETEQPQSAGVLLLGTGGMAPPHSTTFFETACEITDARHIHPFAFRTHTHSLGRVVSGWKVQDNKKWNLIGKKSPQEPQMFYPVHDSKMTLTKGDVVAARCTMVNNRNRVTKVGTTNKDEMCNFYIMYWVKGKHPVSPRTCFSAGPPFWSWRNDALLKNIPEEEASTI